MASDVAALVAEMSDTLSSIRQAIDALSAETYDSRLDDLERQRDSAIAALHANFERETDDLSSKRRDEREEVAERRRREDEEMRERRRMEDEEMEVRDEGEDQMRDQRIREEIDGVEDEMDWLMDAVEMDADASLAEGRDRLAKLEERRKELNRLIDEQIQVPFPTVRTRRRARNRRAMDAAITSKPVPTHATPEEPFSDTMNVGNVACGDSGPKVVAQPPQQVVPGVRGFSSSERKGGREKDMPVRTSTGLWEPGQSVGSRADSGSLTQPGGRTSGLSWISGKMGSSEGREVSAAPAAEPPSQSTLPTSHSRVTQKVSDRSPLRGTEVDLSEEASIDVMEPVVGDAGPHGLTQAVESVSSNIPLLSEGAEHDGEALQLSMTPEISTSGHGTDDGREAGDSYDVTTADVKVAEAAVKEEGMTLTERTVFGDYESHQSARDSHNGSLDAPQYTSEDLESDQLQTLPLQSLTSEVTSAPVPNEVIGNNCARSESGDESTPEPSPPSRGLQENMPINNHDDEMASLGDSVRNSPSTSALQSPAGALGMTTDTLAQDMNYIGGADVCAKHFEVPVELPIHAMDYCSILESVQLPDGTWSTGMIEPELYQALVAQFLAPEPHTLQVGAQDLLPTSPVPEEEPDSLRPSDTSTFDAAPHIQGTSSNDIRYFTSASFINELQPVVVQLADGTWSVDPSSEEHDAAVASSRACDSTPIAARHGTSATHGADSESMRSTAALDDGWMESPQPVAMQLQNSEWATDPSKEEYRAAATQLHRSPADIDHVAVATESQWTPMSDASQKRQLGKPEPTSPMPIGMDQTKAGPAWWESSQVLNSVSLEREISVSGLESSEMSSDGEDSGHLVIECETGGGKPGAGDRTGGYGQSGAGPVDTGALPWSPVNSKYPLSPTSPSSDTAQSPSAEYSYDRERKFEIVTPLHQDDNGMTDSDRGSASPPGGAYSSLGTPDNLFTRTDMLNTAESTADTESQSFVTPLQSAGLGGPLQFQDKRDLLFRDAVNYTQSAGSPDENAMTVHGHDELFDSEDGSDPEPNPNVDEDEGPSPRLDMPQEHNSAVGVRQVDETMIAPTTPVLQAAPEFSTPQSARHSPKKDISEDVECDVDAGSLSPQELVPAAASRGLAFSRHNPGRPTTPQSQTIPDYSESDGESWDASEHIDSTPMSLVSQSTLSSSPGSPVVLRGLDHEIEMQGTWSRQHIHHLSLSGHDHTGHSRMDNYGSADSDYDSSFASGFKISEEDLPTPIATQFPSHDAARQFSPANPSPSTLVQKMRSVFESQKSAFASPTSSRPVSGAFGVPVRAESPGYDVPGEPRKGGFLGEAEDEVDERSALLGVGSG